MARGNRGRSQQHLVQRNRCHLEVLQLEDRITPSHGGGGGAGTTGLALSEWGALATTAGTNYTPLATFTASGASSYTWSESGSLDGMTFTPGSSTATLSGTPITAGSFNFSVTVQSGKTRASHSYTLTVAPGAVTQLTVTAPGTATAGTPFSVTISAYDSEHNLVSSASGSVSLSTNPSQSFTPGSVTMTNGTVTTNVTLNATGNVTLTASMTVGTKTVTGTSGNIYVTATGADWFAQNMADSGLQNQARTDFTTDGSITYSDMVGLLNLAVTESQTGGVTSAIFTSLQALVSSSGASYLKETADVQNLGSKLVNGDPSNAYFQGNIALGNLKVGSTATQLLELTEKWFLGEDHPIIDTQYWGTSGYALAGGTLFNSSGAPSYQDVYQGEEGDCWLLASFGVTANSPTGQAIIESQFTYEGTIGMNGAEVWSVRFYHNGVAQYVTVDNYLPVNGSVFMFANFYQNASSSTNTLWVALDEKAYAELCGSGWNSRPTTNSYASLNGGSAQTVLPLLTNGTGSGTNPLGSQTNLINAINAGTLVTFGSGGGSSTLQIVPNHDYGLLSYNSSTGQFTLLNPWGWNTDYSEGSYNCPGLLYLTYSQITSVFGLDGNTNPGGVVGQPSSVLASEYLADPAGLDMSLNRAASSHAAVASGYMADTAAPDPTARPAASSPASAGVSVPSVSFGSTDDASFDANNPFWAFNLPVWRM